MIDAPWSQLNDRCAAFGQVCCTSSLFKEQVTLFKEQVVPTTCQNGRIDHLAGAHRSFSKPTGFKYSIMLKCNSDVMLIWASDTRHISPESSLSGKM